jgi:TPR repeat protein
MNETELKTLIEKAEGGDADAQYELGAYYEFNYDFDGDCKAEAYSWYSKAAKQGHQTAEFRKHQILAPMDSPKRDY